MATIRQFVAVLKNDGESRHFLYKNILIYIIIPYTSTAKKKSNLYKRLESVEKMRNA